MGNNTLGNLVNIKTGKLDANASSPNGKYPFFTCSRKHLNIDTYSYDCKCVLVAGNGDLNVKYYEGKFDAYQRTYIIESKNESVLYTRYLYWFLSKYVEKLRELSIGGVIKYIKLHNLTDPIILLPSLEEQKRIVKILDKADSLKQKRKQAIELLDEYLISVFLEMFGDPVKNQKNWEKKTTINYADCIVPGRDKPKSFTGDTPWVTTDDLLHLSVTDKSNKNIGLTTNEINTVRAKVIPKESVVITCVGDLGIASIAGNDMVVNQQLHAFQCKDEINNYFFMYSVSFQKLFMYKRATKTTVPYMNKSVCNSIPMINPPLQLQNKFAEFVQASKSIKQKMLIQFDELETQFEALSQKAFKGEL